MPHRVQEAQRQEIQRNALRRLSEKGIGSRMEVRRIIYAATPNFPLLEQHRGCLRSVGRWVEPGEFSEPDREMLYLEMDCEASVRGGLELLSQGHARMIEGPVTTITVTVPYSTRIQVKNGVMRFGEEDAHQQTHDTGLTPMVFIHVWFDPNATNGNGKKR